MDIAYWVKGEEIINLFASNHIQYIARNPELFGYTYTAVEKIFTQYGEQVTQEGNARDQIIKEVSKRGWIRVRRYTIPKDYWSIQFDAYHKNCKAIRNFIEWAILEEKIMTVNDEVHLLGYFDGFEKKYYYHSGGIKLLLEEKTVKSSAVTLEKFFDKLEGEQDE